MFILTIKRYVIVENLHEKRKWPEANKQVGWEIVQWSTVRNLLAPATIHQATTMLRILCNLILPTYEHISHLEPRLEMSLSPAAKANANLTCFLILQLLTFCDIAQLYPWLEGL